jgi:ThiF family
VIWYLRDLVRARQEREALEALAVAVDWLRPIEWRVDPALRLTMDVDIVAGGRIFPISLRYPNHFPHSPPLVLPRGDGEPERWSSHQYGSGGELCLEFGPDNWHPDLTGRDMIESAFRLLAGEQSAGDIRGEVASRHSLTLGQRLSNRLLRLVTTPELRSALSVVPLGVTCAAKINITIGKPSWVVTVASFSISESDVWVDTTIPAAMAKEATQFDGMILRWPPDRDLPPTSTATEFRAAVAGIGASIENVDHVLVVKEDDVDVYFIYKDDVYPCSKVVLERAKSRVAAEYSILGARDVAIIGCGSLGSKIALMLARAGVSKFLLIDDDIMLPDNLARHDLDWRDVGLHKVIAVSRRIELVNSAAKCDARIYRLGGQQSSGSIEVLIETIAQKDLIIDATADIGVFGHLCAAVALGKKPMLWAEVFGGGFGGLIARHRPGLEPDPASMRCMIENWCVEQGGPIERATRGYGGQSQSTPMIADDSDVSTIAGHAARMAIDLLLKRDPSMFPHSVYLVGLAKHWNFDQPFDTRPIDVGGPIAAPEVPINKAVEEEERVRIGELIAKYLDAVAPD